MTRDTDRRYYLEADSPAIGWARVGDTGGYSSELEALGAAQTRAAVKLDTLPGGATPAYRIVSYGPSWELIVAPVRFGKGGAS